MIGRRPSIRGIHEEDPVEEEFDVIILLVMLIISSLVSILSPTIRSNSSSASMML